MLALRRSFASSSIVCTSDTIERGESAEERKARNWVARRATLTHNLLSPIPLPRFPGFRVSAFSVDEFPRDYNQFVALNRTAITAAELDLPALIRHVDAPATGAIATFVGLVRDHNQGRRVLHLVYEAYEPLAERALQRIVDESRERWPTVTLAIHHRTGRLAIGEASVAIAAASPHRSDAFAGCRYAIERIKQIVPIWKHEYFEGGDVWIEGATADPEDQVARDAAMRIACA